MIRWNKIQTKKSIVIAVLLFFSGVIPPITVFASSNTAIGQIIALRGLATATDNNKQSRKLTLKSKIAINDHIKTDRRSRLQIMFTDNTIISLGPVSDFSVKDYAWDLQTKQGKMTSRVNEGVFRVLGGSITKTSPQNFTTETPSATIGIRGSMYAGKVRNGKLDIVFQGGKGIYIRNPLGTVDISTAGFGVKNIDQDKAPSDPIAFTQADMVGLDPLSSNEVLQQPSPTSKTTSDTQVEAVVKSEDASTSTESTDQPTNTTSEQSETMFFGTTNDPVALPAPPAQSSNTDSLSDPIEAIVVDNSAAVSGRFRAVQDDLSPSVNIADLNWIGNLSGSTNSGKLTSTAMTNQGDFAITPFTVTTYNPSLLYTGSNKVLNQTRTVSLLGNTETFNVAEIITDNTGEFTVFTLDTLFNSATYKYRELGFLGTPTLTLPNTGISRFVGPMLGTLNNVIPTDFETIDQLFNLEVNWHNGKVFGAAIATAPNKANGFFFGNISGTEFIATQFFGNDIVDMGPGPILAIDGNSNFGQFYGNQASGVGFEAAGSTYNVLTQVAHEDWDISGAGFRETTIASSSTGTVVWKGFTVGVAEDMNNIDVDRRLFINQNASDFSLNINRDTGDISGTLNAIDAAPSTAALNNLQFGGSNGSAYISDHILATGIGGGTPVFAGTSGPLKTFGNYLISQKPSDQLANYVTWGSWEIAYTEPGSGDQYHLHMPGSLWVAGELTSPSDFASLNFTATYNGRAEGVHVPNTGQYNDMPTGTASFNVDFNAGMLTSGSIVFPAGNGAPGVVIGVSPTSVSSSGFSAYINTPHSGSVNGAFFGPAAASTAGNFDAQNGSDRFIGVFGADR